MHQQLASIERAQRAWHRITPAGSRRAAYCCRGRSQTRCSKSGPLRTRDHRDDTGMSACPQGACCANAHGSRHNGSNQRDIFILALLACIEDWRLTNLPRIGPMLFQPKLHQFNFRLLIGNDLLRQPAHLRIFAEKELYFSHVNCCLMVGSISLTKS